MATHIRTAASVFTKTYPFVLLRIGVGILFGLLMLVYFGLIAGVLWLLGPSLSGGIVFAVLGLTVGAFLGTLRLARKYVLYLVSAGHIAVITQVVDTGEVPDNQLRFGKDSVTDHFASASALFVVDRVVKTVLTQFNRAVVGVTSLAGFVPALKQLVEVLRRAVALAGRHIDEAVLAHIFRHDGTNNWRAARDGLVLYAKSWKSVLLSAVLLVGGMYLAVAVLAVALSPVALALGVLSPTLEVVGWVVALGALAVVYFGLVSPFVKTVIITTFLVESRGKSPDSETMDALAARAERFREVLERADRERAGTGTPDRRESPQESPGTPGRQGWS